MNASTAQTGRSIFTETLLKQMLDVSFSNNKLKELLLDA